MLFGAAPHREEHVNALADDAGLSGAQQPIDKVPDLR